MSMPSDPAAVRSLEQIASVHRQLGDAVARLADAAARAVRVAGETDWRTDAATLFHSEADAWRSDVAALSGAVDDARDDVGRLRSRIEAHAWGYGG